MACLCGEHDAYDIMTSTHESAAVAAAAAATATAEATKEGDKPIQDSWSLSYFVADTIWRRLRAILDVNSYTV